MNIKKWFLAPKNVFWEHYNCIWMYFYWASIGHVYWCSCRSDFKLRYSHFCWDTLYNSMSQVKYVSDSQFRLNGFKQQPVDHSMRPYFMMSESMSHRFQPYCVGSVPRHIRFMGWFKDVFRMYQGKRKFMFGFHSEMSHNDNNQLKSVCNVMK